MASAKDFALLAVALLACAIMIPIGMQIVVGTNTAAVGGQTAWGSAVITLWQVLLPVLFIIGIAIYFIPHGGG